MELPAGTHTISEIQSAPPHVELTKWQEDPQDILIRWAHELAGDGTGINEDGQMVWIPHESNRIISDAGIRFFLSLTGMYVNKNTQLTDISEEQIKRICKQLFKNLAEVLFKNQVSYNIDKTYLKCFTENVVIFIYMSLMKSKDGGERKFLKETEKRVVSQVKTEEPGKWLGRG